MDSFSPVPENMAWSTQCGSRGLAALGLVRTRQVLGEKNGGLVEGLSWKGRGMGPPSHWPSGRESLSQETDGKVAEQTSSGTHGKFLEASRKPRMRLPARHQGEDAQWMDSHHQCNHSLMRPENVHTLHAEQQHM